MPRHTHSRIKGLCLAPFGIQPAMPQDIELDRINSKIPRRPMSLVRLPRPMRETVMALLATLIPTL